MAAADPPHRRPGTGTMTTTTARTEEAEAEETEEAILRLTATELVERYLRLELSPVEVTDLCLRRIQERDGDFRCFLTVTPDLARAQARVAAEIYRDHHHRQQSQQSQQGQCQSQRDTSSSSTRGGQLPSLLGVPITLKDLVLTKGVRTTFGSLVHKDNVPLEDAPLVERLLHREGAVLLGKTKTPEYGFKGDTANRLMEPTINPWLFDRKASAGGSSGGAAASIATGMGYLAHGTDGAGSIRIPAHICGVVGFKPSRGLIPLYPSATVLSHAGPLARSVRDCALMTDAMAGYDERDQSSFDLPEGANGLVRAVDLALNPAHAGWPKRERVRVGVITDYAELCPPGTASAITAAQQALMREGFELVHFSLREILEADDKDTVFPPWPTLCTMWRVGNAMIEPDFAAVRHLIEEARERMHYEAEQVSALDYAGALQRRERYHHAVRQAFRLSGCHVWLSPALTVTAANWTAGEEYPLEWDTGEIAKGFNRFLCLYNLTGQPAIVVPAGLSPEGAPIGVQLAAPFRHDALLLRVAALLERSLPPAPRVRLPPKTAASERSRENTKSRL